MSSMEYPGAPARATRGSAVLLGVPIYSASAAGRNAVSMACGRWAEGV